MEPTKPTRHKHSHSTGGTNFTKYLPRATTFTVPNRPYSPGRTSAAADTGYGAYHHHNHRTSFSGPISIVPPEARQRKPATGPVEPTSPKVSCIGQVKRHKDAACRKAREAEIRRQPAAAATKARDKEKHKAGSGSGAGGGKPPRFAIMRFLRSKSLRARTKDNEKDHDEEQRIVTRSTASPSAAPASAAAPPPIGQLKRFSSGRTALAGFDWRSANAAICPLDPQATDADSPLTDGVRPEDDSEYDGNRGYCGHRKGVIAADDDDDDDSCKIPHSAPMVLGGGTAPTQPNRNQHQVNLWKRRTMAPPKPLQLNC